MTTAMEQTIRRAVDRFGADINNWPDRDLAQATRAAALADPGVRAWLDEARALASALGRVRDRVDEDIVSSGAAQRVVNAVLDGIEREPQRRRARWVAVAATLLLAAGLGGFSQMAAETSSGTNLNVVVLDPLVFGPAGIEQ